MPLVNKTLLRTGIYEAPQGTLNAHHKRIARWVDTFKRMRAADLEIPICWGHQPDAEPGDKDDRAAKQYWLGKYNAGYLRDLSLTPDGTFDGKMDCPGVELKDGKLVHWIRLPDGREVQGAIGEVSIAVRPFKDGKGRDWGESVVHVGLTPLPVASGMGGFTASNACTDSGAGFTLCLTNLKTRTLSSGENAVADDYDDETPKKTEGEGEGEGAGKDHFAEGLEILRKRGISLPEDTTAENFWDRLCVVGHALDHAETQADADLDPDDDLPTTTDDEGVTVGGEDETPVEEPRPMMMSLAGERNPTVRALGRRVEKDHKASLLERIDSLCKRVVKPSAAAELRAELSTALEAYTLGFTLSNDGEIEVRSKYLDRRIRDLEMSLPARHPMAGRRTNPRAQVVDRPGDNPEQSHRRQEQVGDELAAMAGAPARPSK